MREDAHWYHLVGINPEPWTSPNIGGRRKNGSPVVYKNEGLRVYQEAVKDELKGTIPYSFDRIELRFYFWRRLEDSNRIDSKRHRSHQADATNMQKALEDALQGVLFANDRDVVSVSSWVVAQGPDVTPRILISVREAGMAPVFAEWPVEPLVSKPFGGIAAKEFDAPNVEELF